MGSCMSTPSSDEPKRAPESSNKQPTSTSTTPAPVQATNTSTDNNASTPIAATLPNSAQPSTVNGNGLLHDRTGSGPATGPDRGSDAQAISAALASTEGSIEKRGSKDRSNAIDKKLEDDQRKFKKECKILLLGESTRLSRESRGGPILSGR